MVNQSTKTTLRDPSFDILKGLGILLMIMGHVGFGELFSKYIHAFHMPLFFLISGYFYKKRDIKLVIQRKFRNLLVPYITFGIFHLLVWVILEKPGISEIIGKDGALYHLFIMNSSNLPIAKALWFLITLFFVEVIWVIIDTYIDNHGVKAIVIISISLVGMLWRRLFVFRLPECLDIVFACLIVYALGIQIRWLTTKNKICWSLVFNIKLSVTFLLLFVNAFLIIISPKINVKSGEYGIILPYLVNCIMAFIAWLNLSRHLSKCNNIVRHIIESIGTNSIIYLCLNQLYIMFFQYCFYIIPIKQNAVTIAGGNFAVLILTVVSLYFTSLLFMSNKVLRFCIGKN